MKLLKEYNKHMTAKQFFQAIFSVILVAVIFYFTFPTMYRNHPNFKPAKDIIQSYLKEHK